MKVLSLFDGISCAMVALERAGFTIDHYFASELDKYAISVSHRNYPGIIQLGDVKGVFFYEGFMGNTTKNPYGDDPPFLTRGIGVGSIDLLIGGSPCQDLSIAKKNRQGLDGERSGLFWEYVRILQEVKPKRFILENVNSMPKEARQTISETLGVEPIMINAALVSAQNRKRLFRTNIPGVTQPEDKGILLKDILQDEEKVDDVYRLSSEYRDRFKQSTLVMNGEVKVVGTTVNPQAKGTNSRHWVHDDSGKIGTLSATDYKQPKQVLRVGQFNQGGQGDRVYSPEGKSVTLSALGGGRGAKTGLYHIQQRERGYNKGGIHTEKSPTLSSNGRQENNKLVGPGSIRKLTPIECERLQGLPDNYTEGISNTQRYKCLGNAFNVDVVAHILSFIPKE